MAYKLTLKIYDIIHNMKKKYLIEMLGMAFFVSALFFVAAFWLYGFENTLILISLCLFVLLTLVFSSVHVLAVKAFKKKPGQIMKDIQDGISAGIQGGM